MNTCQRSTRKLATSDERMLVLAYLISLRNVRVEVTLAVELCRISKCAAHCSAEPQDMTDCFAIDDRECTGVRETDRADVHVRTELVRVIRRCAEHLSPSP